MSINHHSYNSSDPHWWSSHHMMQQITTTSPPKTSSSSSKHDEQQQQQRRQQQDEIPKEPMFEKSLTPSDVGKLNRLVIPKQYAEKYFPLNGLGHESNDQKGLLLSFEDEVGKTWRFRYSYWNSSQSYVLTKGWSRFVKDKKLEAGDVVLFLRDRLDHGCLFIGWRRKNDNLVGGDNNGVGVQNHGSSSLTYQPDQFLNAGSVLQNQTTPRSGNSKRRLRLFGVNLECQVDESEPSTPDDSQMSSQLPAHQYTPYHYQY